MAHTVPEWIVRGVSARCRLLAIGTYHCKMPEWNAPATKRKTQCFVHMLFILSLSQCLSACSCYRYRHRRRTSRRHTKVMRTFIEKFMRPETKKKWMRKIASAFVRFSQKWMTKKKRESRKIFFKQPEIKHIFLLTAGFYSVSLAVRADA